MHYSFKNFIKNIKILKLSKLKLKNIFVKFNTESIILYLKILY